MKRIGTILLFPLTLTWLSLVVTAAPADSKSIASFVDCLNTVGTAGGTTVADTVEPCIPDGCKVIVTMGPTSAQAACTLGTCQLPRVIFDCPGSSDDLRFRPSYLLCPINSKGAGDEFGMNRIEVGEDTEKFGDPLVVPKGSKLVPTTGKMKMADIPIPPGNAIATTVAKVLSVVVPADPDDGLKDSKKCNACHIDKTSPHAALGDPALSAPIDPFGLTRLTRGIHGADYVIDISASVGKTLIEDAKKHIPKKPEGDGTVVMNQPLDQICDCINNNQATIVNQANGIGLPPGSPGVAEASKNPNVDPILLLNLCRALAKKIQRAQVQGGGVFQDGGAGSLLRLDLTGQAGSSSGAFTFADINGALEAYSYTTQTSITSVVLSTLEGTLLGRGDFQVTGAGSAIVNGTPSPIHFQASHFNSSSPMGFVTFEITDGTTGRILASGIAQNAQAALELTFTR